MKSKTRQAIIPRSSTAKRLVGTDISAWQGTVRWEKIPSDFNYVIMRASIGLQRDSEFKDTWKGAAQVRKTNEQFRRGAYHVIKYDLPAKEQVELFLDATLGEWKVGDLPGSLDVEGRNSTSRMMHSTGCSKTRKQRSTSRSSTGIRFGMWSIGSRNPPLDKSQPCQGR